MLTWRDSCDSLHDSLVTAYLACQRAPGQLTGGVVTEVQLCGQDEEVNWQPGPVQCIQLVKVLGY